MTSSRQFSPLCDLHHVSMRRMVLGENPEEVRSYHACARRDCTRIFRDLDGYTDLIRGGFDDSRALVRTCPRCGAVAYLAQVDHAQKIETWECPQNECDFSEESPSPSAR
jgi:hypothetical protein